MGPHLLRGVHIESSPDRLEIVLAIEAMLIHNRECRDLAMTTHS